jgi:hypothetical protein
VLFGSGQNFRLGGALALTAGLSLDVVLVAYVFRPKRPIGRHS